MQRFAKELVTLQPDLILSQNTPTTAALLQQTRTIPIVFANRRSGRQRLRREPSAARRQRHRLRHIEPTMAGKWLELLKEIAPRVNRVAFLFNPATAPYAEYYLNPFKAAAASLAVEAIAATCSRHVRARNRHRRTGARAKQWPDRDDGQLHCPSIGVEITSLAARYRLPAIYPFRFFAELGGLLSYGNDLLEVFGARRPMPIASSRVRSRASFRCRPRSSSNW